MFVAQLAFAVAMWALVVALMVRRRGAMLRYFAPMPRGRRVGVALAAMLGSVVLLGLGMAALASGGLRPSGLTWWGWPAIVLTGAGFVALQTVGLVPLMLNAVTGEHLRPSDKEDSPRS